MQQNVPARILSVHDLSCVGRCALTVISPTLSAMGYQVIPLPTALLSSHTGGFDDLYFRDLSEDMHAVIDHFDRLDLRFRAVYTGFLGSERQIRTVEEAIARFGGRRDESGETPLILIDPVMGDDGRLYSTYTESLCDGIRALSRHAHVLTPNLTEAAILTETPYPDTATLPEAEARRVVISLLERLCRMYPARTVITGVRLRDGSISNVGAREDGSVFWVTHQNRHISYPGTGDIFASVLLGRLLSGASLEAATVAAADFVEIVIRASEHNGVPVRFGVSLEPELWRLCPGDAHSHRKED